MYRELLYSAGGGIINNRERLEQEDCINIVIGLGGTGIDCLRVLKRKVFETVKPDGPGDENPSYAHIKFLAVDTDQHAVREDSRLWALDREREFLCISNVRSLYNPDSAIAFLAQDRPELAWFNKQQLHEKLSILEICHAMNGAGGVRQIGRLYMIEQSAAFCERVSGLIREAVFGVRRDTNICVHIFSGLGGGTGSGSFLDVCYLVQKVLEEYGLRDRAYLFGYFFQPDVKLSMFQAADSGKYAYMLSNSYAALKELDYCMNFETNGGKWDQQYIGFRIGPTRKSPVNHCFLIGDRQMDVEFAADHYKYAMNVVAEHVIQFVVKDTVHPVQRLFMGASLSMLKKKGVCADYTVIGASEATVPIKEISTYLGSRLFMSFSGVRNNHPTYEETTLLASQIGINNQGMQKHLMDRTGFNLANVSSEKNYFCSYFSKEYGRQMRGQELTEVIMEFIDDNTKRVLSQVDENIAVMRSGWAREQFKQGGDSIAWRAFAALRDVAIDPSRGPFYAAKVLGGSENRNLITILQEMREVYLSNLNESKNNEQRALMRFRNASKEYLDLKIFLFRKSKFNELIEAAADFYTEHLTRNVLIRVMEMIPEVVAQLKSLYRECFLPYSETYGKLLDTFHENVFSMRSGDKRTLSDDAFIMCIPKMDARMMDQLDGVVAGVDCDQAAYEFNSGFFTAFNEWEKADERKIVRHVSDYVTNKFPEYMYRPMWHYPGILEGIEPGAPVMPAALNNQVDAADAVAPHLAGEMVYKKILKPLYLLAEPLYRKRYDFDPSQYMNEFIFIPQGGGDGAINDAIYFLTMENSHLVPMQGNYGNRVFCLRYLYGVPMSSHAVIDHYRQTYLNYPFSAGRHIYEGTQDDQRDWRRLPDPAGIV